MIAIEINKNDQNILNDLLLKYPNEIQIIDTKQLIGDFGVMHATISLTSMTLPFVTKILLELIRSKKNVSLKYKGVEVKGISEKNVVDVLNNLLEIENKKKAIDKLKKDDSV